MKRFLLVTLLVLLVGCRSNPHADDFFEGSREVDRSDLGDAWPLRPDHGMLVCSGFNQATFVYLGVHFAVTPEARATGAPDIERIAIGDVGPLVELADEACPG